MKKILLIVLLISFSWGCGQNLSLSQLMSLRTMELDDMEELLTQKGWDFRSVDERTEDTAESINFIYSTDGSLEFGEAFLSKMTFWNGDTKIWLQISKQSKYSEYLNAVKSFKPTLIYSGTEDGNLVKIYEGATTTFQFTTSTVNNRFGDAKVTWFLLISSN